MADDEGRRATDNGVTRNAGWVIQTVLIGVSIIATAAVAIDRMNGLGTRLDTLTTKVEGINITLAKNEGDKRRIDDLERRIEKIEDKK